MPETMMPDGTENPPPLPPDADVLALPLDPFAVDLARDFARWYVDGTQAVAA
jgi:hypothetical protein